MTDPAEVLGENISHPLHIVRNHRVDVVAWTLLAVRKVNKQGYARMDKPPKWQLRHVEGVHSVSMRVVDAYNWTGLLSDGFSFHLRLNPLTLPVLREQRVLLYGSISAGRGSNLEHVHYVCVLCM